MMMTRGLFSHIAFGVLLAVGGCADTTDSSGNEVGLTQLLLEGELALTQDDNGVYYGDDGNLYAGIRPSFSQGRRTSGAVILLQVLSTAGHAVALRNIQLLAHCSDESGNTEEVTWYLDNMTMDPGEQQEVTTPSCPVNLWDATAHFEYFAVD